MTKLYFHGSKNTFSKIAKELSGHFEFTADYNSSDIVLVEMLGESEAAQLDKFSGKRVFAIFDRPDRNLILEVKKHKIAGILTAPLSKEVLLGKLKNQATSSDLQDIVKYETLKAKIIAKAESIPPLPKIARELILLSSKENVEMGDVIEKIKSDQGIASKLLKIINSPFYGMRKEITSLERAALLLGLQTVKNIAISLSTADFFNKNFTLYGTTGKKLWEHSFIVARLCEEMAHFSNLNPDTEALYLAGLFHDIGKVILIDFLYENVSIPADESRQLGLNHIDVAEIVLKKWNIAGKIIEWVKNHHEFKPDVSCAILYFANMLANEPDCIQEILPELAVIAGIDKERFAGKIAQILGEDV